MNERTNEELNKRMNKRKGKERKEDGSLAGGRNRTKYIDCVLQKKKIYGFYTIDTEFCL
jgi:hypothetical protein